MREGKIAILLCLLMIASTAPAASATSQDESVIWGVSYDWAHFENDVLNVTGVDINEVNRDLEEAAKYAGFHMDYDQILSGTSEFFVESWDEAGNFTIDDINGTSHAVTKRITELTIRHGNLADAGMLANWSDGDESIDTWMTSEQQTVAIIDATYVEYIDQDLLVYGADLQVGGQFAMSTAFEFGIDVRAAGETLAPEISSSASLNFDISSLSSQWRVYEPIDYYSFMASEPNSDSADASDADYSVEEKAIGKDYPSSGYLTGDFTTETGYSLALSLTGFPAEELELDIDAFNIAISDSIPNTGVFFEEEMPLFGGAIWGHDCPPISQGEKVLVNGTEVQAQCGLVPPIPWGMMSMLGFSMFEAFESSVQQLGETMTEEASELLDGFGFTDEGGDYEDTFVCDNGQEIPTHWVNDDYDDCEDGSDEGVTGEVGYDFYCDNGNVIPTPWINDGRDDCGDNSDEGDVVYVWDCHAQVGMSTLAGSEPDEITDALADLPGWPEWCGEALDGSPDDLVLTDSEPNLPPPEELYAWIPPYSDEVAARSATHSWHDWDDEDDCTGGEYVWNSSYGLCGYPVYFDNQEADANYIVETMDESQYFARYAWVSGEDHDYLFIANPTPENSLPSCDDDEQGAFGCSPGWYEGHSSDGVSFDCVDPENGNQYWSIPGYMVDDGKADCPGGWDETDSGFGSEESEDESDTFVCESGDEIPADWVNDGYEDCMDGSDEDGSVPLEKFEKMAEALSETNLEKTMEAFGDKLVRLVEDNLPGEPIIDIEELCGAMLWTPSDSRTIGLVLVYEGRIMLGPSIIGTMDHPINLNVEYLSGQAARDAKAGSSQKVELDQLAPQSKHDVKELYDILGEKLLPNLDQIDTDMDGTIDYFDTDDDNDGISDWEDSEPLAPPVLEDAEEALEDAEEVAEEVTSGLPAPGVVAVISVLAAAAILISRRED